MIRTAVVVTGVLASSTLAADLHVNLASGPYTTIQSAINSAVAGDRVLVEDLGSPTVYFEDIDFLGKDIAVMADPMNTFDITLQGSGMTSVVTMTSGEPPSARLERIRVTNGWSVFGGGIRIENSSASLRSVVVERCIGDYGAGISVVRGRAFLEDVHLIANNEPTLGYYGIAGGGLYAERSTVLWKKGGAHDNRAQSGGGIYARQSYLEVASAYFIFNDADFGGGVFLAPSKRPYRFYECDFTSNNASPISGGLTTGGGAMIAGGNAEFVRTNFRNNWSWSGPGGGIAARGGSVFLDECAVVESGASHGGGIYLKSAEMEAVLSDIINNQAGTNGGGVQVEGKYSHFNATKCRILENRAIRGGGLAAQDYAEVHAIETEFGGNWAEVGGGVYAYGKYGRRTLEACYMYENSAGMSGGAIQIEYGAPFELIAQSHLEGNAAGTEGGGIFARRANLLIQNSRCCYNSAAGVGGGLFSILCTPTVALSVISNNTPNDVTGGIVNIGSSIGGGC